MTYRCEVLTSYVGKIFSFRHQGFLNLWFVNKLIVLKHFSQIYLFSLPHPDLADLLLDISNYYICAPGCICRTVWITFGSDDGAHPSHQCTCLVVVHSSACHTSATSVFCISRLSTSCMYQWVFDTNILKKDNIFREFIYLFFYFMLSDGLKFRNKTVLCLWWSSCLD